MDAKQANRAYQEASQKAALIHRSGMPFFCTILEESVGDFALARSALQIINSVVKRPDGTVVRDVSNIGKLLLTANDEQLIVTAYVPPALVETTRIKFTAYDWIDLICTEYGGTMVPTSNELTAIGVIANDPKKNIFVFKLKDTIIGAEYAFLRGQGALPAAPVDDDDDELLGDDAFSEPIIDVDY